MKKIIVLLFLMATIALGQDISAPGTFSAYRAELVKTYTTYLSTSDDTTGFVTVPVLQGDVLLAREVYLIAVATDSVHATINIVGSNSKLPLVTAVYVDSIPLTGNVDVTAAAPQTRVIALRAQGVNRLAGMTRFKIGTVFLAAAQQGNTAGRTLKWYTLTVR